jgi:hypothetical protein
MQKTRNPFFAHFRVDDPHKEDYGAPLDFTSGIFNLLSRGITWNICLFSYIEVPRTAIPGFVTTSLSSFCI